MLRFDKLSLLCEYHWKEGIGCESRLKETGWRQDDFTDNSNVYLTYKVSSFDVLWGWVGPNKPWTWLPLCVWVCLVMGCQLSHSRTKHLSWSPRIHNRLILLVFCCMWLLNLTFKKNRLPRITMFEHGVIWTILKRGLRAHKVMQYGCYLGGLFRKIPIAQTNKLLDSGWWTITLKATMQLTIDEHKHF